ncbi:hypothetical protein DMA15_03920 [Streptomyces sp. WAC 01529]|uniref:hypothetical protein n=1 Tax=Streptomyces sp. WAC 01529 TaxID=2203205 RepID=UPI000F7015A8|nr:hypothetical protein [Streptomyces sp. WAC 01529]AZM51839.1 hypothetical protein DMA15_03920 [Streptomyces sp. WAC 01529]
MADDVTPDEEMAKRFEKYRRHLKAEREMRPGIMADALEMLRRGAGTQALADWTGKTDETFRTLARKHGIEPPPEYKSRSEKAKRRAAGEGV